MTDSSAFTFRASWPLAVTVILAFIILIGLGSWQAQKVGPKKELLAAIESGLFSAPMPLPVHLDDPKTVRYRRVSFDGIATDAVPIRMFGINLKGKPGYFLYKPVMRQHGQAVLVNFGWIPLEEKSIPALPVGTITVTGVLMESAEAGSFTPVNMTEKNEWYNADVDAMAAFFGLGTKEYYQFRIFSDHVGERQALPRGGQVRVDIPNDHFEYMLTWYGLAASLVGVFAAYSIKRRYE